MRVRLLRLLRRQSRRRRLVSGVALSLAIHLLVFGALFVLKGPAPQWVAKRGDALFVELPDVEEPAVKGAPAPPAPAPAAKPVPAPPVAKAAPKVAAAPAPKAAPAPTEPKPPQAKPAAPPRVAKAPPPPGPEPAVTPPDGSAPAAEPSRPLPPAPAEAGAPGDTRTAAVAPTPREPAPDLRSALRRGGADGRGDGRGGIEGEAIPLDSTDPKYADYLERIRRMIKANWAYPCVKNAQTRECEYKSAQLVIEFGIAKDGRVPFVTVRRSSGYAIMDDYAVNAVKLASPFPPLPDALSRKGIPIVAHFHYVVESSLTNLLR